MLLIEFSTFHLYLTASGVTSGKLKLWPFRLRFEIVRGAQEPSQRRDLKYIHIHIYTIIYSPEMACRDGVPQRTSSLIPIDAKLLISLSRGASFAQSWIDHLEDDRRRAGAEALNEPQQLHGLTVRPRATTATY